MKSLDEDGFVIVENLLPLPLLEALRNEMHEMLGPVGRNSFEGFQTQRIYLVLARTSSCNPLIEHPLVLDLLDTFFLTRAILSGLQA
ncbi:MAG: hypothetical protein OEN21_13490 [Myxococcales bacterium]|nr:hypothetical protein [Myxococcales bacterium]